MSDQSFKIKHTLNVRTIEPRERHQMIFTLFERLQVGEALVLVNDHAPRPLMYQFIHEYPEQFQWDYLQEGPDEWQVRIAKVK
ncbi:MAG: DUF2249 domain-containing protein [Anaerolinea sp.]|nr:DUF2249 domain-containing protein [Anaerolinea sp.]MCC6975382.1 DUF2249 domain-containing protein [Anaerolineae bacterium]